MNWSSWMINYEIWSCAVCPIKRWRVPSVQSCHDQSQKLPPPQTRCIFIPPIYQPPLYVHLYTSPYKHLVPSLAQKTCALWSKFKPSQILRRKTLLPGSSIIMIMMITFPMIDFPMTTISVQFCAFSIDWHVNKMRMNQKVNQMTNSLFTLIHHRSAGPIYFFCKKADRELTRWNGQRRCLSIC